MKSLQETVATCVSAKRLKEYGIASTIVGFDLGDHAALQIQVYGDASLWIVGRQLSVRIDAEELAAPFQARVAPWMEVTFGPEISGDREERNHRFLEEALELVQSCGCTAGEAHQLVDYVFGRPVGDPVQEVGGVMVTLAALCLANAMDMHDAGEVELARIWTKVEQIRAKQAAKPKHSPLPGARGEGA